MSDLYPGVDPGTIDPHASLTITAISPGCGLVLLFGLAALLVIFLADYIARDGGK